MNRSKKKGTAAESAVAPVLGELLGWPTAERRALNGSLDKGDIAGIPRLCFEVKDAGTWQLPEWLRQTESERVNAKADYGILIVKPYGVGHPNAANWLSVMELAPAMALLQSAVPPGERHRTVEMKKATALQGALKELKERERHCGDTPVHILFHGKRLAPDLPPPGYSLMRLSARCRLLVDAGYGGYGIMSATVTSTMRGQHDDARVL